MQKSGFAPGMCPRSVDAMQSVIVMVARAWNLSVGVMHLHRVRQSEATRASVLHRCSELEPGAGQGGPPSLLACADFLVPLKGTDLPIVHLAGTGTGTDLFHSSELESVGGVLDSSCWSSIR